MPQAIIFLVLSMLHRRQVTLQNNAGQLMTGIVNRIEAEDGSGTSFNVTLDTGYCYLKRPVGLGTLKDPIKSHQDTNNDISPSTLKKLLTS